jgi:hypothetical protein
MTASNPFKSEISTSRMSIHYVAIERRSIFESEVFIEVAV